MRKEDRLKKLKELKKNKGVATCIILCEICNEDCIKLGHPLNIKTLELIDNRIEELELI
jgi:hypothetical protein